MFSSKPVNANGYTTNSDHIPPNIFKDYNIAYFTKDQLTNTKENVDNFNDKNKEYFSYVIDGNTIKLKAEFQENGESTSEMFLFNNNNSWLPSMPLENSLFMPILEKKKTEKPVSKGGKLRKSRKPKRGGRKSRKNRRSRKSM